MSLFLLLSTLLFLVSVPALLFPQSRRWAKKTVFYGFFGVILAGQFVDPLPQSTVKAGNSATQKGDPQKEIDFHCLSYWDGSLTDLVDAVTENLREPDSFEHIETKITRTAADGSQTIFMRYRARNGFGGMSAGLAMGRFRNADCKLLEWHTQQ